VCLYALNINNINWHAKQIKCECCLSVSISDLIYILFCSHCIPKCVSFQLMACSTEDAWKDQCILLLDWLSLCGCADVMRQFAVKEEAIGRLVRHLIIYR